MRRTVTRVLAAMAAGAALSSLGLTGASASGPATGAQLWASRYTGVAGGGGHAAAMAVSPGGRRVFVAGDSFAAPSDSDYAVVAYNAATGARQWVRRYSSSPGVIAIASSVAVSPSGKAVYVTGYSGNGYATVAYNAATGARQWVSRYNGPASSDNLAAGLTVGPGGKTVYVTGSSFSSSGWAYATVAYNAATGAQRWAVRDSGNGSDNAHAVAVSPGGGTVLVTGSGYTGTSTDYLTVAYDTATGAQRWTARYSGPVGDSIPSAMTFSPSGKTAFVTGDSRGATSGHDYATVAYNTATGAQLWTRRYNGPANRDDSAASVAVTPGGGKVLVTGYSQSAATGADYATVAYNAVTGAQLWARRYSGPARLDDEASSVAVSPGGRTAYVTGYSGVRISGLENASLISDYATVAYDIGTGAQRWVRRYNGPARRDDEATSVTVSPTGSRVFVTGFSVAATARPDFATIAYRG